jgi:IMP dehydrogenase/GMP reductase
MASYLTELVPSYCFDDVLIRPRSSDIASRLEVSLATNIGVAPRHLWLKTPLISSPMDTITDERMAISMALLGGLGIIHRYMNPEDQVSQVASVKRYVNYVFREPYMIDSMATVMDALEQKANLGVSTFCVMDNGNFVGLITRRDLEGKDLDFPIRAIMTPNSQIYKCFISKHDANQLTPTHPRFINLMTVARDIMIKHSIEKVPVFYDEVNTGGTAKYQLIVHPEGVRLGDFRSSIGVYPQVSINRDFSSSIGGSERPPWYDKSAPHGTTTPEFMQQNLYGLITRRSVQHFFDNQNTASLDARGRLIVGAAIGIRPGYIEQARALVAAGADCLCIDVANGHNMHTLDAVRALRAEFADLIIMAGNICTAEGYLAMAAAGADCVRVGIGSGSICTTRLETGVGFGQWSALRECATVSKSNIHVDISTLPKLISDGGTLNKTGNKVKALAAGAHAIMLGRTLASCIESPGQVITRNGSRVKYFRGMASTMANLSKQESQATSKRKQLETDFVAEGIDGLVEVRGSVSDVVHQINGGLRSGLSYLGVRNIDELHTIPISWGLSTSIGLAETNTRLKTL